MYFLYSKYEFSLKREGCDLNHSGILVLDIFFSPFFFSHHHFGSFSFYFYFLGFPEFLDCKWVLLYILQCHSSVIVYIVLYDVVYP